MQESLLLKKSPTWPELLLGLVQKGGQNWKKSFSDECSPEILLSAQGKF